MQIFETRRSLNFFLLQKERAVTRRISLRGTCVKRRGVFSLLFLFVVFHGFRKKKMYVESSQSWSSFRSAKESLQSRGSHITIADSDSLESVQSRLQARSGLAFNVAD